MPEDGLLRIAGSQEPQPDKFTSLAFVKLVAGLQTQRSPFQSLDNRYSTKFLGGKPDALLAGRNVEINNSLLLQRRPGVVAYGPSIDPPNAFYEWQLATTGDINLIVDTEGSSENAGATNSTYGQVLRYTPTHSGVYINKAQGSKQTNIQTIVNTMYMGDGVDLFKNIGPNLLTQSNTFSAAAWAKSNVSSITDGQTDPVGGTSGSKILFSGFGSNAYYIVQTPTLNYTPLAKKHFHVFDLVESR